MTAVGAVDVVGTKEHDALRPVDVLNDHDHGVHSTTTRKSVPAEQREHALNKLDFINNRDLDNFHSVRQRLAHQQRVQQRAQRVRSPRVVHRHFVPLENVSKMGSGHHVQNCLVDGFTRRSLWFDSLRALCLLYYDETTSWDIDESTFREMMAAPNGRPFFNEWTPCNRWQISYCLTMYPNGREPECAGYVKWGIEFDGLPDSVVAVVAMLQLTMYGRTRGGEWVEVRSFKRPNVFTDEFSSIGNYRYSLRKETLAQYTALRVSAFVDVMDVEYNDPSSCSEEEEEEDAIEFIPTPIRLEKHRQFEWRIEDRVLGAMKNEVVQRRVGRIFLSPSFGVGGNWALYGRFNANDGVDIGLRLLRLPVPNRIRSVAVDYWLEFSSGFPGQQKKVEFSSLRDEMGYENFNLCFQQNTFSVASFNACPNLSIYVTIEILNVTDFEDRQIPRAEWPQYGVK